MLNLDSLKLDHKRKNTLVNIDYLGGGGGGKLNLKIKFYPILRWSTRSLRND